MWYIVMYCVHCVVYVVHCDVLCSLCSVCGDMWYHCVHCAVYVVIVMCTVFLCSVCGDCDVLCGCSRGPVLPSLSTGGPHTTHEQHQVRSSHVTTATGYVTNNDCHVSVAAGSLIACVSHVTNDSRSPDWSCSSCDLLSSVLLCRLPENKLPLLEYRPDPRLPVLLLVCVGVVGWWVAERHSPYGWILQDILGNWVTCQVM